MKNAMKISSVLLVLPVLLLMNCTGNQKQAAQDMSKPSQEQLVQRGQYLVTIMGCNDCHSPKQMGPQGPVVIPEKMLSGFPTDGLLPQVNMEIISKGMAIFNPDLTASAGPWGMSFSANLTSDQTGIGNWTEENFKRALKEGKYKGLPNSRTLLPPMPWTNLMNISDEDVSAIFAYLKSIPPVNNLVQQPIPLTELINK